MTAPAVPGELVALAGRMADASRAVIRRWYRQPFDVVAKADDSPVTIADREAEAAIRAVLAAERPRDGIIGEEHGTEAADAEWVWVLDPIDGTKSFLAGRPIFGTLIALVHGRVPVLGVIDQAVTGERWIGGPSVPTTCNGEPVRVRPCAGLAEALVATTGPELFAPAHESDAYKRLRAACLTSVWGGDCYNYALVAHGQVDLVVETGLKPWDFCALVPVIEGAGGIATNWAGRPIDLDADGSIVAAGDPRVHAAALELLAGGERTP